MNTSNLKQHGIALIIFLAISFVLCLPAFQGKVLQSHDNMSWKYMSQEAMQTYEQQGGSIYWSNSMFSGMPSYTFYGGAGYGNYLATVLFKTNDILPRPFFLLFIGFICFYVLASSLRWNQWIRIIASTAFALSSYNPILAIAGHDTKFLAIAFAAMSLGGIIYILNNQHWKGAAIFTLGTALLLTSAHMQIIYYTLMMYVILGISMLVYYIAKKQTQGLVKKIIFIVLAGIIGILPALSSTILTKDYSKYSIRGGKSELTPIGDEKKQDGGLDKDYAFSWSNGIGETFCVLIPRLYGGGSSESYKGETYNLVAERAGEDQAENFSKNLPLYWGPQPFLSGPIYFGAIVVFLFVLSVFLIRSPHKWWIVISSVFFILLSVGKHFSAFNYFLFDHLPLFNNFRTPSMALSIPMFLFPVLGFWALNDILNGKIAKEDVLKYLKISTLIVGGIVLVVGVFSGMFLDFRGDGDGRLLEQLGGSQAQPILDAIIEDRKSAAMKDGLRSLFLIMATAATLWFFMKEKLKAMHVLIIVGLLSTIDLLSIANRYLNSDAFTDKDLAEQAVQPRDVDAQILQDKDPFYRVQDFTINTYNDAKPSYFHKMVGGYHPAKLEIYQDLIERQLTPGATNNSAVYNMLNTKYFIVPAGQGKAQVIPNPNACGNAWFVPSLQYVNTADEEMKALNAPNLFDTTHVDGHFDPKKTAIVRTTFKAQIPQEINSIDSSAYVKLNKYGLNELQYESSNTQDGFAVFSDIYYAGGWVASIDGKESPIIRTNYVLRGLFVPKGKHNITFTLKPHTLNATKPLSMLGCVLVLALFGFGLFQSRKEGNDRMDSANG
ncbi:MAG: YfhO family protein [Chitinophagaceae bacterium]